VVEPRPSVVHRFDPELSQLGHALAHVLDHLRRRALPARDLLDDPQWLSRSVGPGRVPGEALVGEVRIVFDRSEWLDPSAPLAASELSSQWRALVCGPFGPILSCSDDITDLLRAT
jgi:hypothetical protein